MARLFSPFAALCTVGFFARLSYALARSPVLPLFALHLGAGPEAVGFAVGISTITGIFFKLPAGALSDIIGRKRTMLIGLFFFAVIPFTYFWVRSYLPLIIIRFIHGFATSIYGPVSMAVIADAAGARKGEMLSWFSSITIIGNLLGAPLGGFILHPAPGASSPGIADFQHVYLLSGIAGMMSLLLAVNILRGDGRREAGKSLSEAYHRFRSGIAEVMSDKRIVVTSAMEGLQNLTTGALEAFLPIYAVTRAGLNEFEAGLLWSIQVVATILSRPAMGRISDRFGRKPLIAAGMFFCAGSFAAVPLLQGFAPLLAAAAVFGVGESFVTSSSAALVADVCKEKHFGTAMGAFGTIFDIGHASGPVLAGILIARYDYLSAFLFMAVLLVVAVPLFVLNVQLRQEA